MNTTKLTFHIGLVITMLMAIMTSVRADNNLTYTKIDKDGSAGEVQKMMIRAGKMRIDLPGGQTAMIYDSVADKVYILEMGSKKYITMDPAMMKQMMAALTAMKSQLEAKLASMPEAQRAQMKAMMSKMGLGGGKAAVVKRVETGRMEKVGDYQAEVIEVTEDGVKAITYYLVDRKSLKVGDAEYATMHKFQAFLGKMMESLPGPMKQSMKVRMLLAERNQLPVKADRFENGVIMRTDQLTEVSSEDLDPGLFQIPADFQKRELPFGPGGLPARAGGR